MINFEESIEDLLKFIFYYGASAFSVGLFYSHKNVYNSLTKYIKRNPHHFKLMVLSGGSNYYVLSDELIETKMGLFDVLIYPRPKDYLETFQALLYLSLCIEKNEFRKQSYVDFTSSNSGHFIMDNLDSINTASKGKAIITFEPRVFTFACIGHKTLVPKVSQFRTIKKILLNLSNLHLSNNTIKTASILQNPIQKSSIRKNIDDSIEELLSSSGNKVTKK